MNQIPENPMEYLQIAVDFITEFYFEYTIVGVFIVVLGMVAVFFVLKYFLRLLRLIGRKIHKFFRVITGVEKKRKEEEDKRREIAKEGVRDPYREPLREGGLREEY